MNKFTTAEAIFFLGVGFLFGMFFMALINFLEVEWADVDAWFEKHRKKVKKWMKKK